GTNITMCFQEISNPSHTSNRFLTDRQLLAIKARFHGRSVFSRKSDVQDYDYDYDYDYDLLAPTELPCALCQFAITKPLAGAGRKG
ncbi:MAG: hypothetical protein WCU90_11620, partial [Kiritimatiellia bacterium]